MAGLLIYILAISFFKQVMFPDFPSGGIAVSHFEALLVLGNSKVAARRYILGYSPETHIKRFSLELTALMGQRNA